MPMYLSLAQLTLVFLFYNFASYLYVCLDWLTCVDV